MDSTSEENKTVCIVCQKEFKRRSALYRHLRGVHKLTIEFANRKHKFKCPDTSCSLTFHLAKMLRNHIKDVHGLPIKMCFKTFKTYDEFMRWKEAVQDKTKSLYTSCQNKKGDKYRHFLYTCYRSGGYVPSKASGKRKITNKKIDGWCPSGMEVKVFYAGGGVQVKYWITHFGHECEVDRLNLSHREKLIIAKKLKEGLSFEKILDDIRETVVDGDIKRIHLLSRTDISNISKAFKILPKKDNMIKEEVPNINAWIQSMEALGEDSPVMFFKEKGTEHRVLRLNDYLLVIMTKVQQKLLEMCTHHVVCFDDIRICQAYNYHLIILMAIDDFDIACPLAFGVANKVDDSIFSLILEVLSSKVGVITTNIFMSSDIPALYSTWKKHMGPICAHLLCTWQVDKDWRKSLEKLQCSEEKKVRVYKDLKRLMLEIDFKTFRSQIEETVKQLEADADFTRFSVIFKTKYVERCELWAYCYRSEQLLMYNAILEQTHKDLIECYEKGRVANSFVKTLNLIIGYSRDKILEKLQKMPRESQIGNLGNICQTHQEIQEIDVVKAQNVSEKYLQVPTTEKDCCYVEHNINKTCPPDCIPICPVCSICFHKFTCTCIENFFKLNICRHIFASVNMMKSQCSHLEKEMTASSNIENPELFIDGHIRVTREEVVESTRENLINVNTEEATVSTINDREICDNSESYANFNKEMCIETEECMETESDNEIVEELHGIENSVGESFDKEFFEENCEKQFVGQNCEEQFVGQNCEEQFVAQNCEQFVGQNCEEQFVAQNCEEQFVAQNCEEQFVVQNCKEPLVVQNCEEPLFVQNCEKPLVAQNCEEQFVAQNFEEQFVAQNCQEQVVVQNCEKQLVAQNCEEQFVAENFEEQFVAQNCEEQFVGQICEEQFVGQNCEEQFVGQNCEEQFVAQNCKEQFVGQNCEEQFVGQNCEEPFVAQNCEEPFVTQNCEEPFVVQNCEEQFVAENFEEQFVAQNCEEQFVGQNCEEQFVGQNFEEQFVGQNCEKQFVGQNCEEQFVGQNCEEQLVGQNCEEQFLGQNCGEFIVEESIKQTIVNESNVANECDKESVQEHFDKDNCNTENFKITLMQKTVYIYGTLSNRTFVPEEYKVFDEYIDKILDIINNDDQ